MFSNDEDAGLKINPNQLSKRPASDPELAGATDLENDESRRPGPAPGWKLSSNDQFMPCFAPIRLVRLLRLFRMLLY